MLEGLTLGERWICLLGPLISTLFSWPHQIFIQGFHPEPWAALLEGREFAGAQLIPPPVGTQDTPQPRIAPVQIVQPRLAAFPPHAAIPFLASQQPASCRVQLPRP